MPTTFSTGKIVAQTKTVYAWTGTPNASASTMAVNGAVQRTNLATDPTGAGGAPWNISGGNAAGYSQSTTSWPQSHSPGRTARRFHISSDGQVGGKVPTVDISLEAGDSLSVSFWVYWGTPNRPSVVLRGNVYADAQDPVNGSYKGLAFDGFDLPANVWTFVRVTGTANGPMRIPGAAGVGPYGMQVVTGEDLYITEFIVERGTTVGDYFDGATAGTTVVTYESVTPLVVTGYEAAREVRNVFNPVLGAQATVAAAFPAGLRKGSMTAVCSSLVDAQMLDSALSGTNVVTLTDPDLPSSNMTFLAADSIRVYPNSEVTLLADGTPTVLYFVEFGYQEVTV